ncbi:MAG: helix-turn-helix domain-containing protein [Clostridia bacterium]|nr:helix-turn-helix domain-containing protein [Clostridia bacterium]
MCYNARIDSFKGVVYTGRQSSKANKNMYQLCREACGFTRAGASEKLEWISDSRIEKIESGKTPATPEEVVAMQKAYKKPNLCSYYCARECAIGRENGMKEYEEKPVSEIVLDLLAAHNKLNSQKDRLIEITCDGKIDDDAELKDFVAIQNELERLIADAASLRLWLDSKIADGNVDEAKLRELRKQL